MHSDDARRAPGSDASLWQKLMGQVEVLSRERPSASVEEILQAAINHVASAVAMEYTANVSSHAEWLRERRAEFQNLLIPVWGASLDSVDVVIETCREYGSQFNDAHRDSAAAENAFRFEVLVNLHARACRTAQEVGTLLRSGYAKGALARWRTIHELSLVAFVISAGDDALAERYLLHDELNMHRDMVEYNKHCVVLGATPFAADELADAKKRRDDLIARFGRAYEQPIGWASELLRKPSWSGLERLAGLEHLRPYYSWSSHGVHPTPKGGRLSYVDGAEGSSLEAGPNTAGLADPASATLTSLTQLTTCLLTWRPNEIGVEAQSVWLLILRIVSLLRDEADRQLAAAHQEHERRVSINCRAGAPDD